MIEAANILNHAIERSLLILDEIGRGVSTKHTRKRDCIIMAWGMYNYNYDRQRSDGEFTEAASGRVGTSHR